jgi:hypothetical protein
MGLDVDTGGASDAAVAKDVVFAADSDEVGSISNGGLGSSSNENLRASEGCRWLSAEVFLLCERSGVCGAFIISYEGLTPGSLRIKNHSRNSQLLCEPLR